MKQKDFILIGFTVFVSAIISLILSNILISSPKNRQEKVEIVQKITDEFKPPDSKYFNAQAINPTQLIQIGDNQNPQPFSSQ